MWKHNVSQILTLRVMNISRLPTGILTVWPSSTPAGTGTVTYFLCTVRPEPDNKAR